MKVQGRMGIVRLRGGTKHKNTRQNRNSQVKDRYKAGRYKAEQE